MRHALHEKTSYMSVPPVSLNEMEWSTTPSFKGAMARPTISTNREAGTGNHNGESHGMTSASNWSKNVGGS